jgi:fructokinase
VGKPKLYGGIEAGGTKFVCLVASEPGNIVDQVRVPTSTPDETLGRVVEFFRPFVTSGQVRSIGVGCFGPLDLDPASPGFGHITSTPKPGWQDADMVGPLRHALNVNVSIDTDVNAAALGELTWGASRGCDPSLYLTIGTGIGGGYLLQGKSLVGLTNLEMGHLRIPHDLRADPFAGSCPFHGDCFEGLASGSAITARLGVSGENLPAGHPFWEAEANYIAAGLVNYILTLAPTKVILGGGVMQSGALFPRIRDKVQGGLNGYIQHRSILAAIDTYIVPPSLGGLSGSLGAIALARRSDRG